MCHLLGLLGEIVWYIQGHGMYYLFNTEPRYVIMVIYYYDLLDSSLQASKQAS